MDSTEEYEVIIHKVLYSLINALSQSILESLLLPTSRGVSNSQIKYKLQQHLHSENSHESEKVGETIPNYRWSNQILMGWKCRWQEYLIIGSIVFQI